MDFFVTSLACDMRDEGEITPKMRAVAQCWAFQPILSCMEHSCSLKPCVNAKHLMICLSYWSIYKLLLFYPLPIRNELEIFTNTVQVHL